MKCQLCSREFNEEDRHNPQECVRDLWSLVRSLEKIVDKKEEEITELRREVDKLWLRGHA